MNIPVLGKYLFGIDFQGQIAASELLIALIPHIVRAQDISALDMRGISAGTDQTVKLRYGPRAGGTGARGSRSACRSTSYSSSYARRAGWRGYVCLLFLQRCRRWC